MLQLLMLVAAASGVTPAPPQALDADSAAAVTAAIQKDREDTRDWLKSSPTSYLAAVSRRDFGDQTSLTVGRAPDCDVRIDDPEFMPHHLRVTVMGDSFSVRALDSGATFKAGDADVREAKLGPDRISVGRFSLRLSHQRFPAIIVFDPQSPRYKEYKGIPYFPADLSYRYVLPLTRIPEPDTVIIMSTRGNQRRALRVGWFDFLVGRKPVRLEATRLLEPGNGDDDFGIFFHDATCGKESYELGRYVGVEALPDGRFVLDFNMTYNPACAYSEYYNCPIPPKGNRIDVAIRAGEQDPHYLDH